ncbi:hypothetical protein G5V58_09415 [Nocardioides anomalus]|uniref:Uncharacterized protein n=1 Tax=Nocardioides anomalus TaxID=2712223 RepID=A0A6G6WD31_9ACTN|nr:hypothetical protein [Nocardioides anomalus]QIG42950.1 hypothetical protein G5V58_09415 [Nocardioides anomalus]
MSAPGTTVRAVTVDRRRHRRIVLDLVVDLTRHRPARWWVGAALLTLFAIGAGRQVWYAGPAVAVPVVLLQLLVWWLRAARSAADGLAVGQTVSTGWAADGELVVTDVTGQYRLPRGSVLLVRRSGRNANVYGRSLQFVIPGELLSDDDVAFLEGHAAGPGPVATSPSGLARSLRVTEEVQTHLVADATWTVVRTADFLLPYVGAAGFALLGLLTTWAGFLWLAGALLALAVPAAVRFVRWRRAFRAAFPIGRVLHAEVTPEHLAVETQHGTQVLAWDNFAAVSSTDHNVLLRHRRRAFGAARTTLLPLGLFRPEDIHQLAASVGGRR